jgi:hypothetical protein
LKYYNKYFVDLNQKQQIKKMKSQTLWQLLLSNRDAIKKTADENWWIVCIIKQSILFLVYLLVYIDRNHIGMNLPMLSFMFCHIEQYSHHFGLLEKRSISLLIWYQINCLVHDRMNSGYTIFKYTKTLNYECHWRVAQDRNEQSIRI